MSSAVGYLRVSSQGQVEGSGFDRQRETIENYAKQAGYDVKSWYSEAFTGTEVDRPEFARMVEDLLSNGCRVVLIESLDRLARDLIVSNQLIALLLRHELTLISASTGQDITQSVSSDPMLKALVQIQSVFAELEKSLLVRKLQKAREKKRGDSGRCEGRKPFGSRPGEEEMLQRIRQLHRKKPNQKRLGPYQIARILNAEGFTSRYGKEWTGQAVSGVISRF